MEEHRKSDTNENQDTVNADLASVRKESESLTKKYDEIEDRLKTLELKISTIIKRVDFCLQSRRSHIIPQSMRLTRSTTIFFALFFPRSSSRIRRTTSSTVALLGETIS